MLLDCYHFIYVLFEALGKVCFIQLHPVVKKSKHGKKFAISKLQFQPGDRDQPIKMCWPYLTANQDNSNRNLVIGIKRSTSS